MAIPQNEEYDILKQYFREIDKIPLLTAEEEIELSKLIMACKGVVDKLVPLKKLRKQELKEPEEEIDEMIEEENSNKKTDECSRKLPEFSERIATAKEKIKEFASHDKTREKAAKMLEIIERGEKAIQKLIKSSLRLVVKIAKSTGGYSRPLEEKIQDGNIGLAVAAAKFDYTKGCRFSTHAIWWIKQSILLEKKNKEQVIRVPLYIYEKIKKVIQMEDFLEMELGRSPTEQEVADRLGISLEELKSLNDLRVEVSSLNMSVDSSDSKVNKREIIDLCEEDKYVSPLEEWGNNDEIQNVREFVNTIDNPRERLVIKNRFGIGRGFPMTLEEIGRELGLCKEMIRQIQDKAEDKLRNVGHRFGYVPVNKKNQYAEIEA